MNRLAASGELVSISRRIPGCNKVDGKRIRPDVALYAAEELREARRQLRLMVLACGGLMHKPWES